MTDHNSRQARNDLEGKPSDGLLSRLIRRAAGASSRRPKTSLALWLVLVVGFVAAGAVTGTEVIGGGESGVGDSDRADELLAAAGLEDPAVESVLVRSEGSAETAAAANELAARAERLPGVTAVTGPEDSSAQLADGGRVALVRATLGGDPADAGGRVEPLRGEVDAVAAAHPDASLLITGPGTFETEIEKVIGEDLRKAELVSLPIILVILFVAFGALVAASLPLILGVTSVVAAIGGMGPLSQLVPMDQSAISLVVLMGLAVGVDYSLFYVRREREERSAGRSAEAALSATAASVGRAIAISGLIVIVALGGLGLTGLDFFLSMGLATILVVALAVVGSLTALPALLALLGDRIDRGRIPGARTLAARRARRAGAASRRGDPFGFWARLASLVTARPRTALAVGLSVLAAIAVPALDMRTGGSNASLHEDEPVVVAERAVNEAFPGAPAGVNLVVSGTGLGSDEARDALSGLGARALELTGGEGDPQVRVGAGGETALVRVPMVESGPERDGEVVEALRAEVAGGDEALPGAEIVVGGNAAENADFTEQLAGATPIVIGAVLALALVLLLASFRSLPLALAVIGLNLVSVGAAYGMLTLIFQGTWAEDLLGFTSIDAIVDWVPVFTFVILFALSMDYTILVLDRMREARISGRAPRDAAREGVARTAGAVTSAAVVMVAVFSIFPVLPLLEMKMLGTALAIGILIDATLVRGIALPATVALLGERGLRAPAPGHPRGSAAVGAPVAAEEG